jgi:hypothetical protein
MLVILESIISGLLITIINKWVINNPNCFINITTNDDIDSLSSSTTINEIITHH